MYLYYLTYPIFTGPAFRANTLAVSQSLCSQYTSETRPVLCQDLLHGKTQNLISILFTDFTLCLQSGVVSFWVVAEAAVPLREDIWHLRQSGLLKRAPESGSLSHLPQTQSPSDGLVFCHTILE